MQAWSAQESAANSVVSAPRFGPSDHIFPIKEKRKVRVVQYNVLADGLSGKDAKKGGFTKVPPEVLEWGTRRGRLLEEVFRHGEEAPDIIALEEVDHYHDWFKPQLHKRGYDSAYLTKPHSPCKESLEPSLEDGCALFWRRDVATAVGVENVCFDLRAFDGTNLGRKSNQVAILATLQLHDAGRIVMAVTHLTAKKDPKGERARAQQIQQLFDRLKAKALPCIVAMDMNGAPRKNNAADYPSEAYPKALRHPLQMKSAYAAALGAEPHFTTWKRRGALETKHTIDYIFYNEPLRVRRVLLPPLAWEVAAERFPDQRCPSDHVALVADIELP